MTHVGSTQLHRTEQNTHLPSGRGGALCRFWMGVIILRWILVVVVAALICIGWVQVELPSKNLALEDRCRSLVNEYGPGWELAGECCFRPFCSRRVAASKIPAQKRMLRASVKAPCTVHPLLRPQEVVHGEEEAKRDWQIRAQRGAETDSLVNADRPVKV